ncbi:36717_t:CDS:2, partial [Racocetra persica]
LSNKENNWSIRLVVNAVKHNIPCNDFTCEHLWYYEDFPNNKEFRRLHNYNINQVWNPYVMIDKYQPTKLEVYGLVYNCIGIQNDQKTSLSKDLNNNWMCNEWRLQFIDAGHLPINQKNLMTINNYTERMNRTIESRLSRKQTVITFIEQLYGLKLMRKNLNEQRT